MKNAESEKDQSIAASPSYSASVEDSAKLYGYKAANLLNLKALVKKFSNTSEGQRLESLYKETKIEVPSFIALEGDFIKKHLDAFAPQWQDEFKEFKTIYRAQNDQSNLSKEAINALEKLQSTIKECFSQHPLSETTVNEFLKSANLKEDDLLMIRSTGTHEDKAGLANPGGNESLPSTPIAENISAAIGEVAASYVSPKSLSQRLIAGDLNIDEFPVMPVLIQKMVGVSEEAAVMSGVVYSGQGQGTRIQAAPGHGEYVVNSKGAVDNYYVSPQEIVYSEIRPKEFRLAPAFYEDGKKVKVKDKLKRVENASKLQYAPSLSESRVLYLDAFAKFLEKEYEMRMDIEFVYDMDSKTLNIVQARAIPEGSRKALEPSSLSPDFLSKNKDNMPAFKAEAVITPEVNKAAVITNKDQVIITQTIEQALSKFNELGQNASKTVKGVIVQNPSPDTSHEAGVFNASAISVMQVKDIEGIGKAIEAASNSNPVIMDPQKSRICSLNENLLKATTVKELEGKDGIEIDKKELEAKTHEEIENLLFDQGILDKGIFASPLSSFVSVSPRNLPQIDKTIKGSTDLKDQTLGQILTKANSQDVTSTKDLLAIAHAAASFEQDKKQAQEGIGKAELLRDNLEKLTAPKIGESNNEAKEALGYILRATIDGHKKGIVNKDLFKQTMIAGAENYVLLNNLENLKTQNLSAEEAKKEKDKAYLSYFNSQKKFEGLILGEGDSLATGLFNNKYAKIADELSSKHKLKIEGESKSYLIESLKLSDYFLNDKSKAHWEEFAAKTCASPKEAEKLGELVNKAVTYNAHTKWVNVMFTDEFETTQGNIKITLNKLAKAFNETKLKDLKQARNLIKTMESQIPMWADPVKFEELHKELQESLEKLTGAGRAENKEVTKTPLLAWNKDANNMQKILTLELNSALTDVMDKSIKSLQRSGLYKDDMKDEKGNVLQVGRMFEMVKDFHEVMKVGAKEVEFKKQSDMLDNLKKFLESLDKIYNQGALDKKQFIVSPEFSVNRATIDYEAHAQIIPKTLEETFTTIHQNYVIINSSHFSTGLRPIIEKQYPFLLKKINMALDQNILNDSKHCHPKTIISLEKILKVNKNIPLRDHSAEATAKFNPKNRDISMLFSIYGVNEDNRWGNISLDCFLNLTLKNIEFIQKPNFDSSQNMMVFEIKINSENDITHVVNEINQSIAESYRLNHITIWPKTHKRFSTQILDKFSKLSKNNEFEQNSLNSVIIMPGGNITWQQFTKIKENASEKEKKIADDYPYEFLAFLEYGNSPAEILQIHDNIEIFKILSESFINTKNLINSGFDIKELITWHSGSPKKLEDFIDRGTNIKHLIDLGFTKDKLEKLYTENPEECNFIMMVSCSFDQFFKNKSFEEKMIVKNAFNNSNLDQLKNLLCHKMTVEKFIELTNTNENKLNLVLKNRNQVNEFIKIGFSMDSLEKLQEHNPEKFQIIFTNIIQLTKLLNNEGIKGTINKLHGKSKITAQDIMKCDSTQLKDLLDNKITPEEFKKAIAQEQKNMGTQAIMPHVPVEVTKILDKANVKATPASTGSPTAGIRVPNKNTPRSPSSGRRSK